MKFGDVIADARVIIHFRSEEILAEPGQTKGVVDCDSCVVLVEHFLTGSYDRGLTRDILWRCEECDELMKLNPHGSITAIYAHDTLRRYRSAAR